MPVVNRSVVAFAPSFSNKDSSSTEPFFFDVSFLLQASEYLTSASVAVSIVTGTDAHPNNMLSGSASIVDRGTGQASSSGTAVKQALTGGISGNTYKLTLTTVSSAGTNPSMSATVTIN